MRSTKSLVVLLLVICTEIGVSTGWCQDTSSEPQESEKYLIIRTDDVGMSHASNLGVKKLLETGYPITASVMVTCPWYQEAVDILKKHKENTTVGIHLTLNSEWQHYRWGPVAGSQAVPSLVDENGYFFHSSSELYKNNPKEDEIEKEIRAQIERALASGLNIEYVDYHMGTVSRDSVMMHVTRELADEYDLALWGYFPSKQWYNHYRATPKDKIDSLVTSMGKMKKGYNHFVTHVGIDNAELGAMKDMNNSSPLADMSDHRQGELNALTSDQFSEAIKENGITVVPFRKLINEVGLENMRAPGNSGY